MKEASGGGACGAFANLYRTDWGEGARGDADAAHMARVRTKLAITTKSLKDEMRVSQQKIYWSAPTASLWIDSIFYFKLNEKYKLEKKKKALFDKID